MLYSCIKVCQLLDFNFIVLGDILLKVLRPIFSLQFNIISPDESIKSYHPPIALPPLEHAQSSPEMNLFYSNPTDTEGSRYMITSDQTKNGFQSPGTANFMQSLDQNQLPPLKYTSLPAAAPPIYPYSIPPEGAASQNYAGNGNGGVPQVSHCICVLLLVSRTKRAFCTFGTPFITL